MVRANEVSSPSKTPELFLGMEESNLDEFVSFCCGAAISVEPLIALCCGVCGTPVTSAKLVYVGKESDAKL